MNSITEYLREKLSDMVFELKGQTYLNAAKKAKKLSDPRAMKFLQAYKDNIAKEIEREFNNEDGPSKDDEKFSIYYNADKKGIQRLKSLSFGGPKGAAFGENSFGTYLQIRDLDNDFEALVHVAGNKDSDRQCFLRQSLIQQGGWNKVANKFQKLADRIDDSKAMKPFTYIQMFTNQASLDFFYLIDDDEVFPMSCRTNEGNFKDDDCIEHLDEKTKNAMNLICKAINQNHKDI